MRKNTVDASIMNAYSLVFSRKKNITRQKQKYVIQMNIF